jgi:hypothetical protein
MKFQTNTKTNQLVNFLGIFVIDSNPENRGETRQKTKDMEK